MLASILLFKNGVKRDEEGSEDLSDYVNRITKPSTLEPHSFLVSVHYYLSHLEYSVVRTPHRI